MASFIALLLLCTFFSDQILSATDTITSNKLLRDGETIVSNGGIYALGFFSTGNSQKRYVGIWYNKIQEQTIVWVANRDNPINNSSSGIAKIDEKGSLAIFNGISNYPVWSTNISSAISHNINSSTLFYMLLDSGNLALYDENRGDFLWQSFDYPTDTFLPGMKIGWNWKSGLDWSFTSWKSPEDPSTGNYTFYMGRTGSQELFLKKASQKKWRSGPWNGQAWNGVPGMRPGSIISYIVVSNTDEMYSIYSINNNSVLSRVVVDNLGFVRRKTWVESTGEWNTLKSYPDDTCDNYGKCGAFGTCHSNYAICTCLPGFEFTSESGVLEGSQICARKRKTLCSKGDGFLKLEKMKLPDTTNSRVHKNLNINDCEIECRNNCSCTGYTSANVNGSGCLVWFGDLTDTRDFIEGGQDLFVRVDAIELDRTRSTSLDWRMRRDIILGIARGVLYLHQDSRLRIVHRDLKASNILLDAKMNPKISDFGMARIFGGDQTQGNTNRVVGTFGYMPPEYVMRGLFSIKSDVFSFGVLLLEIISGKKNTGFYCEDPSINLIKHAWDLWRDGRPQELVDPSMGNSFPKQEVVKFIQVGILCIQEKAEDRPTMSSALSMLGNETAVPSLKQPAFVLAIQSKGGWDTIKLYPDDICDNYGKCGAFGNCQPNYDPICSCLSGFEFKSSNVTEGSQVCVRKRELLCGKSDEFLKLEKMKFPDTSNARLDMSLGIKDCEIQCRNNCSCTGYASADGSGKGCLAWFEDLIDIRQNTDAGQDLFVRVDAIELENLMKDSNGPSSTKKKLVLLCVPIGVGEMEEATLAKSQKASGYMPPEYVMHGLFSTKSDVFSFGVSLLEIISGEKNSSFYSEDPTMNLIKHAWELWRDGRPLELVDLQWVVHFLNKKFSIIYKLCFASDAITHKKFLRDGETLVSNGGVYALGFFSPGKSQKRYIGIWYNQISEQTVVWVANRDNPIHNSSRGILKIVEQGNLAIFNGSSSNPVWTTNVSIPIRKKINSTTLFYKLLDTGNLVLCDENKGEFLWQSFDFPTDTHLPGMKIGWNLKLGTSWSMASWKSPDDPSTGDYTFGMGRTGSQELFIKKWSQKIWRSGAWNGQSWNGVPGFKPNSIVTFNVVKNQDEMYSIYSFSNTSILSMIVLDYLGIAQRKTWVQSKGAWNIPKYYPDDNCDNYGKCGAFGSCHTNYDPICTCLPGFEFRSPSESNVLEGSQTCVRKRRHLCGKGDGFIKLENIKLPDTSNSRIYMGLDMKDCEIECRNNCSCTGYASAYVNERGCLAWFGDLMDIREYAEGGEELFVRVDASELAKGKRDSKESFAKKKLVLLCVLIAVGGYMPPEYVMHGLFSIKSDVFSFGILILEIISGKKNTSFYNEDPTMNLIKHAWELWRDGRPLELVNPLMDTSFPEQEVLMFIQVGILCIQENARMIGQLCQAPSSC
ncbi:hypothetical protein Sjap_025411 [Stephania japonica]|uniref:non-specific serine/threonine protein kinase n=1 Tax=Stephania japonica TaxID=461633 RepID=A0AAP0E1J8_9MAGN